MDSSSKPSAVSEDIGNSNARKRNMIPASRSVGESNKNGQSSPYNGSIVSYVDKKKCKILEPILNKANPRDISLCCVIVDEDANLNSDGKNDANFQLSAKSFCDTSLDKLPRERCKSFDLASSTSAKFKATASDLLPVFMGNNSYKQSCNRNISRSCRELQSLCARGPETITPSNGSRNRRDMADVQVLFRHHLDEDTIKHQKVVWSGFS